MKLSELYNKNYGKDTNKSEGARKKPVISIEIFPPKPPKLQKSSETLMPQKSLKPLNEAQIQAQNPMIEALYEELKILKEKINPSLVSITYGAGGKNRAGNSILTKKIKENFDFNIVMPHFTCVCSNREYIENYLSEIEGYKIGNILALRGDEPEEIDVCYRDFKFAYQLVEFIKQKTSLEIAVAGYPEGHILADSLEFDIKNLKKKLDKGGSVVFTQFFFENEKFYNYLELLQKNKIDTPVCAGLLPVISYDGLCRMVKLSGIKLSKKAQNHFERWQNSKEDTIKAGIEWASYQAEDLIKNGVDGIHFYTLNKARSTAQILKNVGF